MLVTLFLMRRLNAGEALQCMVYKSQRSDGALACVPPCAAFEYARLEGAQGTEAFGDVDNGFHGESSFWVQKKRPR